MTEPTEPSTNRVARQTAPEINERIRQCTDRSIEYFALHPERIGERLEELDQEWDIERILQTNASSLMLGSLALARVVDRKWYLLSFAVAAFLLQHGTQGWCPPIPLLRRLGVRTKEEILRERTALRALQGHFSRLGEISDAPLEEKIKVIMNAVNE